VPNDPFPFVQTGYPDYFILLHRCRKLFKIARPAAIPFFFFIFIKTSNMSTQSRRKFVGNLGTLMAAPGLTLMADSSTEAKPKKNMFIHHVYFWLKNPESKEDRQKLIEGLRNLTKVKTIQMAHIGVPADTNREVIDRSYAVSWLLTFKNKEAQDSYQVDPIHLKFIEDYSHLWSKVVVYDSVDAF
jgi:hypothetical protein